MASERPGFIKRLGGLLTGFALRVQAIEIAGATVGQVLKAVNNGGRVEFVPQAEGGGGGGFPSSPTTGALVYFNGSAWVQLPHGRETFTMRMKNGVPEWNGNTPPGSYTYRLEANAPSGVDLYDVPIPGLSPGSFSPFVPSLTTGGTNLTATGPARPNFNTFSGFGRVQVFTTTDMRGTPSGAEFPQGAMARTIVLFGSDYFGPPNSAFVSYGPNSSGDPDGQGFAFGVNAAGTHFEWRAGGTVHGTIGSVTSGMHLLVFTYDGVGSVQTSLDGAALSPGAGSLNTLPDELRLGDGTASFDLLDFIVYDHVLTDDDVQQLMRTYRDSHGFGGVPNALVIRSKSAGASTWSPGTTPVDSHNAGSEGFNAFQPVVWTIPAKQGNVEGVTTFYFQQVDGPGTSTVARTNTTGTDLTETWADLLASGAVDALDGYVVVTVTFDVNNTSGSPEAQTMGTFTLRSGRM